MTLRDMIVKALQGLRFGRRALPAPPDAAPIVLKKPVRRPHYQSLNTGRRSRQGHHS